MKRIISIILLVAGIISCENSDDIKPLQEREPSEILNHLNWAYEKNSLSELKNILNYWNLENLSRKNFSKAHAIEKDIYEIYKEFYTPFDLDRIGNSEWGNSIYNGVEYVIVQNYLYYDFNLDSEEYHYELIDTLWNFRPELDFGHVKVLYLSDNYAQALNEFLGTDHTPLGTGGIMNPAQPAEESYERQQFLNKVLLIVHGHWGGYWHLETHPEVYMIRFNEDLNKARIFFRLIYEGGEAEFSKKNGKWTMLSSQLTWIE